LDSLASDITSEPKILYVYNWYDAIPDSVIQKFEIETGIRVVYDVYDSNDVLEAKLLAGNSGYDIVAPSTWPYLARQIPAKLYQKLDKTLLPNLINVDELYLHKIQKADPGNQYAVPYNWSLSGIGVNLDKLESVKAEIPLDSWAIILEHDNIKKIARCGVSMLDEPSEVLLPGYLYLGIDPENVEAKNLNTVVEHLLKVRPYITKFDSSLSSEQLVTDDLCVVHHWIPSLYLAYVRGKGVKKSANIHFFIPKEGSVMGLESFVIPVDAKHPKNAHAFINFLLRPEIAAEITNATYVNNTIPKSHKMLSRHIRDNPVLSPSKEVINKATLHEVNLHKFHRQMTRAMARIRKRTKYTDHE